MGNASEYKTFDGQIGKKAYRFLLSCKSNRAGPGATWMTRFNNLGDIKEKSPRLN